MSHEIMTDEQRTAIEKTIRSLAAEMLAASEQLDIDHNWGFHSDAFGLGFIRQGVLFPSKGHFQSFMRELINSLQRQEISEIETRVAVVSPSVAILTERMDVSAPFKDGDVWSGHFAVTTVFAQVEGGWKIVHLHQSFGSD